MPQHKKGSYEFFGLFSAHREVPERLGNLTQLEQFNI